MLRAVLVSLPSSVALSTVALAQNQIPTGELPALLKVYEPMAEKKQADIAFWTAHGDQVCPLQNTEEKKRDCHKKVGNILYALRIEKNLISGMVDVIKTLPKDEAAGLLSEVEPKYYAYDELTRNFSATVLQTYPRQ
jgi:hypothetical protein